MSRKRLDDDYLLAGLMTHGSVKEAAAALKVSPATFANRLKEPGFAAQYAAARADVLRGAVFKLTATVNDAVNVLHGILLDDTATSSTTRIAAARTLLEYTVKLTSCLADVEPVPAQAPTEAEKAFDDALSAALEASARDMIEKYQTGEL